MSGMNDVAYALHGVQYWFYLERSFQLARLERSFQLAILERSFQLASLESSCKHGLGDQCDIYILPVLRIRVLAKFGSRALYLERREIFNIIMK